MRRFVLVALVGVLAACGSSSGSSGSGGGSGSNAYVDAAMKSYDSAPASTKAFMNKSQARCLISGMVDIIGVDALEKSGVKPNDLSTSGDSPFKAVGKDMTPAQAKDVAGLITEGKCFNFTDAVIEQAGSNSAFGKLSKAKVRCFFDALIKDPAVKSAMASSILGQGGDVSASISKSFSDQSKLFSLLGDCNISPSELSGS